MNYVSTITFADQQYLKILNRGFTLAGDIVSWLFILLLVHTVIRGILAYQKAGDTTLAANLEAEASEHAADLAAAEVISARDSADYRAYLECSSDDEDLEKP